MRLINADALHKSFEEVYKHPVSMFRDSAWWFFGRLEDAPTVDAAPVVHGRWKYHKYVEKYECMECRHFVKPGTDRNYCPNCGAKMDLPEDGEYGREPYGLDKSND